MEDIREIFRQNYHMASWNRKEVSIAQLYHPKTFRKDSFSGMEMIKCLAVKGCRGSHMTEWNRKGDKKCRFRVTVIPCKTMEAADEEVIHKLAMISIMMEKAELDDMDSICFYNAYDYSTFLGRERNVFWCIQNTGGETIDLREIYNTVRKQIMQG